MVNSKRQFFVGGNFKMNGNKATLTRIVKGLNDAKLDTHTEVVVAPPSIYILELRDHLRHEIALAGQNTYIDDEGAYTGEISPWMLAEENIPWVILGHSERRNVFKEVDEDVALKTVAALKNKLKVILCVGEKLEEREADETLNVIERQLSVVAKKNIDWSEVVIAYEPVWAIGTGKVATPEQAQTVHADIRKWLAETISKDIAEKIRIIYGGSVNAKNCVSLAKQPDIDGFLVGGASLKPEFLDIIACNAKL